MFAQAYQNMLWNRHCIENLQVIMVFIKTLKIDHLVGSADHLNVVGRIELKEEKI